MIANLNFYETSISRRSVERATKSINQSISHLQEISQPMRAYYTLYVHNSGGFRGGEEGKGSVC